MERVLDFTTGPVDAGDLLGGQLLPAYHAFVGHDLPNQLVPIQAFARMLLDYHAGALDEEATVLLTRLASLCQRADARARRLAYLGRLLREPPVGLPVCLREVLAEAIAEVNTSNRSDSISYDVGEGMPTVTLSRRLLHQVFVELLRNAAGSIDAGHPGRVEIRAREPDVPVSVASCLLVVSDDGRGIGDAQAASLFEPFAAGRGMPGEGGGLGLFLVSQAVARWRGRLQVRSALEQGTTVTLLLPLEPT